MDNFEKVEDISIEDFFKIDIYNQKQIYELAKNTNILRDKIDSLSNCLDDMKKEANNYLNDYEKKFLEIKSIEKEISFKKKILTDIRDLNEKIETYNQSGIKDILDKYKDYNNQLEVSRRYFKHIDEKIKILEEKREDLSLKFSIEGDFILEKEIDELISESENSIESAINEINQIVEKLKEIKKEEYIKKIKKSDFYGKFEVVQNKYKESLVKLEQKGIDISDVDKLIKLQQEKQNELSEILKKEKSLSERYIKLEELRNNYIKIRRNITNERNSISNRLLDETNIKIKINSFRDKDDFKLKFRNIIGKLTGFDSDIAKVTEFCFTGGEFSNKIKMFYDKVYNMKYSNAEIEGYNGRFINALKRIKRF